MHKLFLPWHSDDIFVLSQKCVDFVSFLSSLRHFHMCIYALKSYDILQ